MKKINIAEQSFNPFELIGKDWMLISAGTAEKWNTMTASWGGVGVMWGKPSELQIFIHHGVSASPATPRPLSTIPSFSR